MMKYLLVEDERFAYEEMKRMMEKLRPDYQLEAWTATVEQTVQFLKHHPVDLMLLDIRLTDGNSFDIFEQIQVTTPVIFTTAYDEHAIQAFKVNSVDYLLKPVEEDDLLAALREFEQFRVVQSPVTDYRKLEEALMSNCKKNRFLIQKGDAYHYVETSDIAFFYSEEKVVFLHTFSDKRYIKIHLGMKNKWYILLFIVLIAISLFAFQYVAELLSDAPRSLSLETQYLLNLPACIFVGIVDFLIIVIVHKRLDNINNTMRIFIDLLLASVWVSCFGIAANYILSIILEEPWPED